jgi:hypothetical protein
LPLQWPQSRSTVPVCWADVSSKPSETDACVAGAAKRTTARPQTMSEATNQRVIVDLHFSETLLFVFF